ncbi:MAG: hypothetical protein QM740_12430 [Acidovorax sp.]
MPRTALLSLCLLIACTLGAPEAAHAKRKGGTAARTAKAHKAQRSPSEETTAERDRRLSRECKGMPNAGACLGYAKQ